jgi:hypothetical protein
METSGDVRTVMRALQRHLGCVPAKSEFRAARTDIVRRIERDGLRDCLAGVAETLGCEEDARKLVRYALANHFLRDFWRSAQPTVARCLDQLAAAAADPDLLFARDDWLLPFEPEGEEDREDLEPIVGDLAALLSRRRSTSAPASVTARHAAIAGRTHAMVLAYSAAAVKWRIRRNSDDPGAPWRAYREMLAALDTYGTPEAHVRAGFEGFALSFNRAVLDCPRLAEDLPDAAEKDQAFVGAGVRPIARFLRALGASHMQAFNAWDMLLHVSDVQVPLVRMAQGSARRPELAFEPHVEEALHGLVDISQTQANVRARRTIGCPFLMLPDRVLLELVAGGLAQQRAGCPAR